MSDDHIVSRTYLKWFEDKNLGKIYCSLYQRKKENHEWSPVESKDVAQICYEKNLYDRETEEEFQKGFENKWGQFLEYLNRLDLSSLTIKHKKKNFIFNGEQVKLVLNFIMIHYKRSKRLREEIKKYPSTTKNLTDLESVLDRKLTTEEVNIFYKKVNNVFARLPQDSLKFFKKMPWLMCVNYTSTPFITSSKPFIWFDDLSGEVSSKYIYAPLSPSFSIIILFKKTKEKRGIVIEKINEEKVKEFNNLLKYTTLKNNPDKPILISNEKKTLEEITKQ